MKLLNTKQNGMTKNVHSKNKMFINQNLRNRLPFIAKVYGNAKMKLKSAFM